MNKSLPDWYQEINGNAKTPSKSVNNQQHSFENGYTTANTSRKNLQSIENKLEIVERLIKFLNADC